MDGERRKTVLKSHSILCPVAASAAFLIKLHASKQHVTHARLEDKMPTEVMVKTGHMMSQEGYHVH